MERIATTAQPTAIIGAMSLLRSLRLLATLGKGVVRGLPEASTDRDPINLFNEWFEAARDSGILMPEAMCLATATPDGTPSARMVLLKQADNDGFVFYTNYGSRKARELDANNRAALVFQWFPLQRQVRVEGRVYRISRQESAQYFHTRARGSRIGAWASRQSAALASRGELEQRFQACKQRFADAEVPLPEFWGGYRLRPERLEFWQGRADRLHDRLQFTRQGDQWSAVRLYP